MTKPTLFIAATLFLIGVAFRVPLERQLVSHVLVLLPALVASGWFAGRAISNRWTWIMTSDWNAAGSTGLLIAAFTTAFWMLPRTLDWSLFESIGDVAKFATLPLLVGIPLALSWERVPVLVRGFLQANAISMALTQAWIYTNAPVRLCISYLTGQQEQLGVAFLWVAVLLTILWTAPALGIPLPKWTLGRSPSLAAGHRP